MYGYPCETQHGIRNDLNVPAMILDARRLSDENIRILSLEFSIEDLEEQIVKCVAT
jgi:hypothetical protein